jgi:hypothetical protein
MILFSRRSDRLLASAGERRRSSHGTFSTAASYALLDEAYRLHDLHRSLVLRACVSSLTSPARAKRAGPLLLNNVT